MKTLIACLVGVLLVMSASADSGDESNCIGSQCTNEDSVAYAFETSQTTDSARGFGDKLGQSPVAGDRQARAVPLFVYTIAPLAAQALVPVYQNLAARAHLAYYHCAQHCQGYLDKFTDLQTIYNTLSFIASTYESNVMTPEERKAELRECLAAMDRELLAGAMSFGIAETGKSRCRILYG